MTYYHGSAATFDDVIEAIENFASGDGWTVSGRGSNTVTLAKFGSVYNFTRRVDVRYDWVANANFDEVIMSMKIRLDVEGSTNYSQEARCNDMAGPFSNVWLFSDEDKRCINGVLQTAADRYTHFTLGVLDPRGMHETDVGYIAATYWYWWRDRENYQNNNGPFNNPSDGNHSIGHFGERNEIHVALPDGLLDETLNFRDGGFVTDDNRLNDPRNQRICDRYYGLNQANQNTHCHMLDFFIAVDNQAQTGGIPLSALPVIIVGQDGIARSYVGELPDVRLCNISGLTPAQSLNFADDEWVVFPLKQAGQISAAYGQIAPQPYANSIYYGFAYRKVA